MPPPHSPRFPRSKAVYKRKKDLLQWKMWAPAILDNFMTRSLLGRHFMHCRCVCVCVWGGPASCSAWGEPVATLAILDESRLCSHPASVGSHSLPPPLLPSPREFGTLGERELLAASLALSSIDNILVLGEDRLNDVTLRAGMGWKGGLGSKRWRW